jgi:acyl-coenzyme A synthetase/AMP-(fatty) acid ligase
MNFDGILIGPAEIESVLGRHPAVADSAAFPLPSLLHQEIPVAAVVLRYPVPFKEIEDYCRLQLSISVPRMFFAMDAIPRNARGKILRRRLTELAMAHLKMNSTSAQNAK